MSGAKIMLIRHAERPSADKSIRGVTQDGVKDKEELTVRGWQRAGALVRFFAPHDNHFVHPALGRPEILFACKAGPTAPSLRPQHSLLPLVELNSGRIQSRLFRRRGGGACPKSADREGHGFDRLEAQEYACHRQCHSGQHDNGAANLAPRSFRRRLGVGPERQKLDLHASSGTSARRRPAGCDRLNSGFTAGAARGYDIPRCRSTTACS